MAGVRKKRNFKDLHLPSASLLPSGAVSSSSASSASTTAPAIPTSNAAVSGSSSLRSQSTSTASGLVATGSTQTSRAGSSSGRSGATTRESSSSSSLTSPTRRGSSARGANGALTPSQAAPRASSSANSSRAGRATGSTLSSSASDAATGADYHDTLSEKLASFGLGTDLELRNEDLKVVSELGSGNSGTVTKVLHTKSNTTMARKVVLIDAKPEVRKQILRELQILHECNSPYIVSFYGAYLAEPHICMCLEYMDVGSLDTIYKRNGPIRPDVCGQVIAVVVHGLTYLYDVHRIIHRDVKPSNILVNSQGRIKICDFGVSGELINSIADTFVGTSTYMSPERILGDQYSVKSDVWSLGISVIELALGRFPFADDDDDEEDDAHGELQGTLSPVESATERSKARGRNGTTGERTAKARSESGNQQPSVHGGGLSMFDLLQRIVNEQALSLPRDDSRFPASLCDFVDLCLIKDYARRPSPKELETSPTFRALETAHIDLLSWVKGLRT